VGGATLVSLLGHRFSENLIVNHGERGE